MCDDSLICYEWLTLYGRDWLKINDFMLELPPLSLPNNTQYSGPVLQHLYGQDKSIVLSQRVLRLLISTLDKNPDYFDAIQSRSWIAHKSIAKQSQRHVRKSASMRGRKCKTLNTQFATRIVELD